MLSFITSSWRCMGTLISTIGIFIYSYLIKRNATLDMENKILNDEVKSVKEQAKKVIEIQKKQKEISNDMPVSRNDLYDRLRKLSSRTKK